MRKKFRKLLRCVKHKSGRANEDFPVVFLTNTENGTYFSHISHVVLNLCDLRRLRSDCSFAFVCLDDIDMLLALPTGYNSTYQEFLSGQSMVQAVEIPSNSGPIRVVCPLIR